MRKVASSPLDKAEVASAATRLKPLGAEAVVIHFLHSYANPVHEQQAATVVRALWANDYVTVSSEILREVREFERGSTAAVNAYVQPIMGRYLRRLSDRLAEAGFPNRLLVTQGNGGTMTASLAVQQPVQTVMSGPAAGAIAAARIGKQAGFPNLIACDMGGTSFDVSLVQGARALLGREGHFLRRAGPRADGRHPHHWRRRRIDRFCRSAGILRVGPESAGAAPGPVCYGRGGFRPTVTDANAILGRVDPGRFPGVEAGAVLGKVRRAIDEHVGGRSLLTPMMRRPRSSPSLATSSPPRSGSSRLRKGMIPRDFALFPFGGAGDCTLSSSRASSASRKSSCRAFPASPRR